MVQTQDKWSLIGHEAMPIKVGLYFMGLASFVTLSNSAAFIFEDIFAMDGKFL